MDLITVFAFIFGLFVGGFISLIFVILTNKIHRHDWKVLSQGYEWSRSKWKSYDVYTVKCDICGKIKVVKIKR